MLERSPKVSVVSPSLESDAVRTSVLVWIFTEALSQALSSAETSAPKPPLGNHTE